MNDYSRHLMRIHYSDSLHKCEEQAGLTLQIATAMCNKLLRKPINATQSVKLLSLPYLSSTGQIINMEMMFKCTRFCND